MLPVPAVIVTAPPATPALEVGASAKMLLKATEFPAVRMTLPRRVPLSCDRRLRAPMRSAGRVVETSYADGPHEIVVDLGAQRRVAQRSTSHPAW